MSEDEERALIRDSIETIRRHTGQKLDGWLAPALSYTDRTLDLIAEHGTHLRLRPVPRRPAGAGQGHARDASRSIPYSLEMNDFIAYNVNLVSPRHYGEILKRQFDRLYAEGARVGHGDVHSAASLPGRPAATACDAFEEALAYITGHDKVWLATGREIARHFIDHHFDAFARRRREPVGEAP